MKTEEQKKTSCDVSALKISQFSSPNKSYFLKTKKSPTVSGF